MLIEATNDYDVFKLHEGNRKLDNVNLQRLQESIQTNNLLAERPILVNKDFYIIDGQHRLEAAKRLDLTIYYIIADGCQISDMIRLNNNQKSWKISDYLNYYVIAEHQDYVKLNDFMKKYQMPLNVAIKLLNGTRALSFFQEFKDGKYKFPSEEEVKECENKNLLIKNVIEYLKKKTSGDKKYLGRVTFYGALVYFFNSKSVKYETFMSKLDLKMEFIRHCTTEDQYLKIFRDIYNFKNQKPISEAEFTE